MLNALHEHYRNRYINITLAQLHISTFSINIEPLPYFARIGHLSNIGRSCWQFNIQQMPHELRHLTMANWKFGNNFTGLIIKRRGCTSIIIFQANKLITFCTTANGEMDIIAYDIENPHLLECIDQRICSCIGERDTTFDKIIDRIEKTLIRNCW